MGLHWEAAEKGWWLYTLEDAVYSCNNTDKDMTKSVEKQSWKWNNRKKN